MFINVTSSQDIVAIDPHEIEAIVSCVLGYKQVSCDELSIHCVTSSDISKLHEEYFDDPSPTDCITFPIDDQEEETFYKVLGDVFICPEVALNYAQTHLVSFEEELTLYIVHGLLHLLGYDDLDDDEILLMRSEEAICMELLKNQGLVLRLKSPVLT